MFSALRPKAEVTNATGMAPAIRGWISVAA
jgi:hypothetical protein